MAWVVDTCMIIDVLDDDPAFGALSAEILDRHLDDGLVICPVSYIELAPAFLGNRTLQQEFLESIGIAFDRDWAAAHTALAHKAWFEYVRLKQQVRIPKRPVADILIGAFAQCHTGLITRNPKDFNSIFPKLQIIP